MGLAHVIGPGERVWFRRCRRAWNFGSPNRGNLEPQLGAKPGLSRAVRMALAVWYFPGMWEWPRAVVRPRALQAFDEAAGGRPGPTEAIDGARAMLERYFASAVAEDAFTPVRVEADFEAGIPDPRTPDQELVDADGRPVRYHDRIHLLVVDARGEYWLVEHRLVTDGWADRDELLLAERPLSAVWGWERFYLGMELAGTVHNELRPGGGEQPFRRTRIRRSRAEVAAVGDRLGAEALEMLDPGLRLYPNPTPDSCGRCDYRAPCLAMNEGSDPEPVLKESYRIRPEDRLEEGRLGGGSWSMSRGAAPPPNWSGRKPPS
jgi:hypothetical protein